MWFDFTAAFQAGYEFQGIPFYAVTLGDLVLPTGRIVACDPLACPDTPAFTRTVSPGSYSVALAIAVMPNADERVGFAMLTLSDAKVAAWEPAFLPGEDATTLGAGEFFGYGVDAGVGCFMDEEAQRLLLARLDALPADQNYYDDVLRHELGKNYKHTREWALHRPHATDPVNVAVFSSGWGDGCYTSWFGLDAHGKLAVLVTDFQTIDLQG